ncbi:4-azaleucine resistance transporter AzlC [Hypnocyclicus thermotrophus]|uniref:4-azaleucine resistance transporter AzlC n=1 Tax=Hypnocyclicus thermotrophus TaxID=1627895 RepID=A0AA46I678_9FUSO|nr:AzlC family ABC transporter permease [Hypnocyclicus thermotrophus]TDT72028.1 4-azaleucine resistance transporter AzlC [Hypnocyclicus thermotrophus]
MQNKEFLKGVKAATPIFLSYFSISITFGLIIKSFNLNGILAILMSMTNFTGATQFISANMLVKNFSIFNIAITTFIINSRYFLMSFCISQKMSKFKFIEKLLFSFGITDEIFVLATTQDKLSKSFLLGAQLYSYFAWVLGTIVGIILADFIPIQIIEAAGISIYIMYLTLLIPKITSNSKYLIAAIISISFSIFFKYTPFINEMIGYFRIILSIILSAIIAAIIIPIEENNYKMEEVINEY